MNLRHPKRIAKLKLVFEQNFDPIGSGAFNLQVHENFNASCRSGLVRKLYFNGFARGDGLLRCIEYPAALLEASDATAPTVDNADALNPCRELGQGKRIKNTDEHELSIALLADVITDKA